MFNGEESIRVKTDLPFKRMLDEVDRALDRVGRLSVDDSGDIHGTMTSSSASFACEVSVSGWVEKRKGKSPGYDIVLEYRINPSVAAILIAVFLFPLGLIIGFVLIQNAQNEIRSALRRHLRDLRADVEELAFQPPK